jgi:hypothetical protein
LTAFTSPSTWAPGTLSSTTLNSDVRDNMKNVDERLTIVGITSVSAGTNKIKSARCGVKCTNSADTTATTGTDKTLTWDTETFDTDGFHSTVSNTHRITIPSGLDGDYHFTVAIEMLGNAGGDRTIWLEDSGGVIRARQIGRAPTASNRTALVLSVPIYGLASADWIAAHYMQDSGSTLDIYLNITRASFSAYRIFAA